MKRNIIGFSFALFFILFSALAAYSECAGIERHTDFTSEHDGHSIHCTDTILTPAIQATSGNRPYSDNFGKSLQIPESIIHDVLLASWSKQNSFLQPFSQRGLFRFLEVYRL